MTNKWVVWLVENHTLEMIDAVLPPQALGLQELGMALWQEWGLELACGILLGGVIPLGVFTGKRVISAVLEGQRGPGLPTLTLPSSDKLTLS